MRNTNRRFIHFIGSAALLLSVSAQAYGPRDTQAYPHPAMNPMATSCGKLNRTDGYGPRQNGPRWTCRAPRGSSRQMTMQGRWEQVGPRTRYSIGP